MAFLDNVIFDALVLIVVSEFGFLTISHVGCYCVPVLLLFLYVILTLNLPFSCCLLCSPRNSLRVFFNYVNSVALADPVVACFSLAIFFYLVDEIISTNFFHFRYLFFNNLS